MDAMLNIIEREYASRTNILNALNIGIRRFDDGAGRELDFASKQLSHALESSDQEHVTFAFDVLNKLCGDVLPACDIAHDDDRSFVNSDGSSIPYDAKISMAADTVNAISRLETEIIHACVRIRISAECRGGIAAPFINVLHRFYLKK
jgi:hypothetical protein